MTNGQLTPAETVIDPDVLTTEASTLGINVNSLLVAGFNNKRPIIPSLGGSGWEKSVIYMPIILIVLPLITGTISALGILLWDNEVLLILNFLNAIPGGIEAIAVTKGKKAIKRREQYLVASACYINLKNMKVKLKRIEDTFFEGKSKAYKKSINNTLIDLKNQWNKHNAEWQVIITEWSLREKNRQAKRKNK
jgi:hypothetical protein